MAREKTFKNEGDVKKYVKKALTEHGWFWWMTPANGFGQSGVSDILALRAGTLLAIETKFGGNLPTINQVGYLESVNAEGGLGFCFNEVGYRAFERWLALFDDAASYAGKGQNVPDAVGAELLDCLRAATELIAKAGAKKEKRREARRAAN